MIDESAVDVRRVDVLPETLEGSTRVGPYSLAKPGLLLRVVPGVGRFLARDGTTIEYAMEPEADERAVHALLEGGILGALMHQRGDLPLHATTLVSPDRSSAVALAGHSGAGKSTTAYELIRRGWVMLSDDLTRITLRDGMPLAWPGRAHMRLLADACAEFGLDTRTLDGAPNWPGKYVLSVPRWDWPVALTAIVILQRTDGPFQLDRVGGVQAARILAEQTYRLHYVAALGQTAHHFALVAATATAATVLRSGGRGSVEDVGSAIVRATAVSD